jgi:hypothetical protein
MLASINLKKAALWTLAATATGGALGAAGYGLYRAGGHHAVKNAEPFANRSVPPAMADAAMALTDSPLCQPVNATRDEALTASLRLTTNVASSVKAPIFLNGTVSGDDIALHATTLQPVLAPLYGTSGMYRAAILMDLASVDPAFIQGMITQTGDESVEVRLHTYDGETNTFKEVYVGVSLGEIPASIVSASGYSYTVLSTDAPAWWLMAMHAGYKLDLLANPELGLTASVHDRNDAKAHERNAMRSIVGVGAEIVSADELDAIRNFENPVSDTPLFDDDTVVTRDNVNMIDAEKAVGLLDAKTDNWSSLLDRMSDKRNVCLVTLHQLIDFRLKNWVDNNGTGDYFNLVSSTSGTGYTGGRELSIGSFESQYIVLQRPSDNDKYLPCGPLSVYSITNTDTDGVWMRIAMGNDYGSPKETKPQYPFYVPNDALQEIAASIAIARRPCAEDSSYRFVTAS